MLGDPGAEGCWLGREGRWTPLASRLSRRICRRSSSPRSSRRLPLKPRFLLGHLAPRDNLRLGQLGRIQDLADQRDYFLGNRQGPQVFRGELFFAAHDLEV
jgi:hypothetical protein